MTRATPALRLAVVLRQRYAMRLAYVGLLSSLGATAMLVPILASLGRAEFREVLEAFLPPALLLIIPGLLVWHRRDRDQPEPKAKDGGVIVTFTWLLICLASSWPFMVLDRLAFHQAVFESVSGWTTTGLSMIDVEQASLATLLWRSTMQLIGGAGFAVIMLAAVGQSGSNVLGLAEGRTDQLAAHVRASARLVVVLYGSMVLIGVVGYRLLGMSLFDAVNHAFCALSTGGFSTRAASIGSWNSPAIEGFTLALMILGSTNFATIWLACRGRLRAVIRNGEIRVAATATLVAMALVLPLTSGPLYPGLGKQIRVAVFETISAITTTGFSTVTYGGWNDFGILVLVILMIIGGGTCSTAGGMKQFRVHLLIRSLVNDFSRALAPARAVVPNVVAEGEREVIVGDARIREVASYAFLYLLALIAGTAILTTCGIDLREALFEFASALGTVGLSIGVTSTSLPGYAVWAMTLAMFLGRLEFTVILVSMAMVSRDLGKLLRP